VIAIDTNVLLRYLLQDDNEQSKKATKLIAGSSKVLITDVVLTEAIWTLKGKKYKVSKEQILLVLNQLFKEPDICFEDGQTIWRALNVYRQTVPVKVGTKKKDADFPDALILEKSKTVADNENDVHEGLYTFDLAAQQIDGTRKP